MTPTSLHAHRTPASDAIFPQSSSGGAEPTPDRVNERPIGLHAFGAESPLEVVDQPAPKGRVVSRAANEVIETTTGKR
jgi:hypothetical protein